MSQGNRIAPMVLMVLASIHVQAQVAEMSGNVLTAQSLIELASQAPAQEMRNQARLLEAQSTLESARRWWIPSAVIGGQSFSREGSSMNVAGEILPDVVARNSQWMAELRLGGDVAQSWTAQESAGFHQEAVTWEVAAERDQRILACMAAFVAAVASAQDEALHAASVEAWRQYEQELNWLVESGLRPRSEALSAASERLHLESQVLQLRAAREAMLAALWSVLGVQETMPLSVDWPVLKALFSKDATAVWPEQSALVARIDQAESLQNGLTRELWLPELRFSPMLNGFGADFSSLAPTTQWVGALMWSIPLDRLLPGGDKGQAAAQVAFRQADALAWDQEHAAQLTSLDRRVALLNEALVQQSASVSQADEALAQSLDRESQGLVTPFERIQLERQSLRAHTTLNSIQSDVLLLEMMRALESGAQWALD